MKAEDYTSAGDVVITTGAIKATTDAALELDVLEEEIKDRIKAKAGDNYESSKVEFYLASSNLVKLSGNDITVKDNIDNVTKSDELRVQLTYNGQSYQRTITIKKG